jgi:hypothetical protein
MATGEERRFTMPPKAKKTTELFIMTPSTLGALTGITTPLQKAGVNVEGYCAYEWGKEAAYRIITDNNEKARQVLSKVGFNVQENPTVIWETNNKPGMLRKATEALAGKNVNIYCSYCTTMVGGKKAATAFTTNNPELTFNTLIKVE